MDAKDDIEKQLRDAIAASGQSLNQLGHAASVNDGQLSRFVRGERTLTLETVGRLCKVLGLRFCSDAAESSPAAADAEGKPRGRGRPRKTDAAPSEPQTRKSKRKRKG